ncbi:AI-2E family transporter [Paenibacillus sp. GYB003]|uniref:AI-2E family transporter n=1 Tax=Paenibacillus sp. GYB003 TaxID=2994392 RepID=UPI002F96A525
MNSTTIWTERFKRFFLNNRFVLSLLVLLLIGLNIRVYATVSYIFLPVIALVKTMFLPVLLTGIAYYLLNPIVDLLEKRGIRRSASIVLLYLIVVALIALLVTIVVPFIRVQIESLLDNFPRYSKQVELQVAEIVGSGLFERLRQTFSFDPAEYMQRAAGYLAGFFNNAWTRIGAVVGAVTEVVLSVVMTPLILFYLLRDGRRLPRYIVKFVPTALRGQTLDVMSEMNQQISSYIRGQIIVSFCIGLLLYVGYLVIGLDYSLVLAVFAACTSVVPYLGPAIAIAPALIIAIVTSPIMLLKMVVVWTIVQLVEGKFISPQIMGKNLHIHPITILFVILTAGKLFGIVGIILAIPGYAILKVVAVHLFRWLRRRSRLYEPSPGGGE